MQIQNTKFKYNVYKENASAHLVHDSVGEVVSEHVEDEAVGSGEFEVVKTPGANLPHQDRPASDDLSKTNFLAKKGFPLHIL